MFTASRAAIAVVALNLLLSGARAAGEAGYASAEQAFEATFIASSIGQRGYDENREYAAALYQMPDGRWYATEVVAGGLTESAIPYHAVPSGAIRIAGAHTHGQPRLPEDPMRIYGTEFSRTDTHNAIRAYEASHGRIDAQWLLTSQLVVLRMSVGPRYDPATARIALTTETVRLLALDDPASGRSSK